MNNRQNGIKGSKPRNRQRTSWYTHYSCPPYLILQLSRNNNNNSINDRQNRVWMMSSLSYLFFLVSRSKSWGAAKTRVTFIVGLPPRLTSFWIISSQIPSQIPSNFLKFPLKFSISSQPDWQAGTIKVTLPKTCQNHNNITNIQAMPHQGPSWRTM